jgi:hypothetical protein
LRIEGSKESKIVSLKVLFSGGVEQKLDAFRSGGTGNEQDDCAGARETLLPCCITGD